ncbi:hypothetical protein FOPE_06040 [Fonsecaea pedrosoi]|nr:hypothetical protein FOPE_06040 [Fonsecaea pedrosoi]
MCIGASTLNQVDIGTVSVANHGDAYNKGGAINVDPYLRRRHGRRMRRSTAPENPSTLFGEKDSVWIQQDRYTYEYLVVMEGEGSFTPDTWEEKSWWAHHTVCNDIVPQEYKGQQEEVNLL